MLRQTVLPLPVLADGMRLPPRSDRGGEGHESAVPGFCRRIRRNAARNTAGRKRQGATESRSSQERLSCEGERAVGASAPRHAGISAMFARPVPLSCERAASVPGRAARGRTPRGGRHFGIDRGGEATVPSASDIRSAAANIRCEMASTLRRNSLKRIAPSGPERRQERLRPSGARSARHVPDGAHSARMKIFRFSIILFL